MLNIKLHTPVGVKDILPKEVKIKKEVEKRMDNLFQSYGYNQVESPMYEYFEVFSDEKMGSTNPKQMYRFFDRKGSELSLRSDMTPPIARIAATAYADTTGPLRFSYFGNVFRYNESYQGKMCELPQAGVELMGVKSVQADAEIITLAVKSILSTGVTEFKVNIGQVSFFKNILKESGLSIEDCDDLKKLIAERNYVGMEELIEGKGINSKTKELFLQLPKLVGGKEILKKAEELTDNNEALQSLKELEELFDCLTIYGVSDYVVFDLGMISSLNYYTGIIFRGYTYGTGYSIVDGGRYDNLVKQFGKNIPSVGFGVKINELLTVIERNNINLLPEETKAMICFNKASMSAAISVANIYRKNGMAVEIGLVGDDFDANLAYAQNAKIDSMLYFVDSINIKYARIVEGLGVLASDITVNDLVRPNEEEEE